MRVFVTGATGFIGSATVQELIGAGHRVLGLARSDDAARSLSTAGAEVHRGSLDDLESLRGGAAASDAVIHTAFIHDWANFPAAAKADERAILALGETLAGSDRPLLVTSGTALVAPGRVVTEEDVPDPSLVASFPRRSEETALAMVSHGVSAAAVRFPASVHGDGDHGFVPILIGIAREKGVSAYVGDGLNRWAAVHRLDAAHLFRLALENGAAGARYHGVGEEGVPFRAIAELIGRHLSVPVVSKSPEEAAGHFGFFARFVSIDSPASSVMTQKRLGWHPTHRGLIEDLDRGHYFESAAIA
ncbi:MAG TPA: SDR family oxidoreductase [Candidatus Acidoferrales bacterium]|jgi:nucleoside-diphosphate-sugar epimerase|nr:SDR family oxidoreductase [Candidatus Acidoferrales bacterium]